MTTYDVDEYMRFTRETAVYPDAGKGTQAALAYVALGLAGEAGEISNKVKKLLRGDITPDRVCEFEDDLRAEAGDVFWYLARLLDEIGSWPTACLWRNEQKLRSRMQRGVIRGSGDAR